MKNLKDNPDAGFSLIEVVVALVMIFFFTTVALQMVVVSSLFKKKATQYTTAINLIQQDIERIKSAADTYSFPFTTNTTAIPVGATGVTTTTVPLSSTTGLTATNTTNRVQFSNDSNTYTFTISGNDIIISPALKKAIPARITSPITTTAAAAVGATTVTLSSTSGLTVGNPVQFSNNSNIYTLTNISGNTITFSPSLPAAILASTSVVVPIFAFNNTSCNLTSSVTDAASTSKIATYFQSSLAPTINVAGTDFKAVTGTPTPLKGQYYWLLRKEEVSNDAPYNVLKLSYVVQPGLNDDPITVIVENPSTTPNTATAATLAKSYTEVIPYASLQCPSQ